MFYMGSREGLSELGFRVSGLSLGFKDLGFGD